MSVHSGFSHPYIIIIIAYNANIVRFPLFSQLEAKAVKVKVTVLDGWVACVTVIQKINYCPSYT